MTRRLLYSIEGNAQKLDGGAMFGNAPKALWERWVTPDEKNRIDLACRSLLIREEGRWILLETGIGAFFSPQLKERYGIQESHHVLLESLDRLSLSHEDIDVVVLSHLHFDHAGGLLTEWSEGAPLELLFPAATYVVSRPAWNRACSPHPRDRASFIPDLQVLLAASERLEIVEEGGSSHTLGSDYRLHFSNGHTPGLMMTEIPGSLGPVIFAADLIPGRPWVHRSITMGYDRFPEQLIDEKVALLDDLVDRGGRLFFTHDPACSMARVTRDERGRYGSVGDKRSLSGVVA
ncbi:MAG: glyoxylase-like metal-dependent hydrolase (beta-lactamase superfamily II) [Myxococcota bacterium]|jgi:glyoxylase-like metal-dependent hydrolase (beta-lactamase superfamily II)